MAAWKEQEQMGRKSGYYKYIDSIKENMMNRKETELLSNGQVQIMEIGILCSRIGILREIRVV